MNEIQKNLYKMLIEIDEICKKHNIIYYLAGGTALGAVRNQGFLPWDDDIDLYMTRSNWLKLRDVLKEEIPEHRKIITNENTDYYYNPIPRYVNCDTTLIYKSQMLCGQAAGQHIEILIMDPMPTDPIEQNEYKKYLLVYTELITPYFVVNRGVINTNSYFDYNLYDEYYKKIKRIGREAVLKELEDILFKYTDEECNVYCMRWGLRILMYDKSMFGTPRLERFEDREFYVAENAEQIFRIAYGDTWMYIPEMDEQVTHNSFMDLETPFEYYVNQYMPKLNRSRILKAYNKNKRRLMKTLIKREQYVKSRLELERAFLEDELKIKWDNGESVIAEMIKNKDISYFDDVYGEIDEFLFSKPCKKYLFTLSIYEDRLYPYLFALLLKGQFSKILALQNRYIINNIFWNDTEVLNIVNTAELFRKISIALYDDKDFKKVKILLDNVDKDFRNLILYIRVKYMMLIDNNTDNPKVIRTLIDELSNEINKNNDGELWKLLGDCYYYLNELESMDNCYSKAHCYSRNGIMLLDIYIKTGKKKYLMVN